MLTLKTMEMDFCVVFCGVGALSDIKQHHGELFSNQNLPYNT